MTNRTECRVCNYEISPSDAWTYSGFKWATCPKCKTTQKLLTKHEYIQLKPTYDPGMFIDSVTSVDSLRAALAVEEKTAFLQAHIGENLAGKRFLDIGCGLGGFLMAAKDLGMQATGFEPSALHYSVLEKVCPGEFRVINDYFDPKKCEGTFDVVMLSHVIEHIYEPASFIEHIVSILNPNGLLLLVTPNNQSIEAKFTGRRWLMYKPVDHVTMIGPASVPLLTPTGTRVVALKTDEYRGEFAVHILSALKSLIVNRGPSQVLSADSKATKQISASSFPEWVKTTFQILSLPFWMWGALTNGLACMTVVYRREAPQ